MGVLNITPDSFADGGRYLNPDAALQQALTMRDAGADIIDLGGESSQPGARAVSIQEQLDRVLPVIEKIRQESDICLSIDTTRAEVMRAAVAAGADLINDIKALSEEGALAAAAELKVPVCLMHMKGIPETMQENPYYSKDVVDEINDFFIDRIERCTQAGIAPQHLILDPGFGFGKSVQHNLWLTKHIQRFQQHGLPLLLGASRKSTLGAVLNKAVEERLIGSIAVAVFAGLQGVAIIRTHDVDETNQALSMIDAIVQAENE
ncbi:dihydropteroate synthase [Legionella taurinensis]|uniref:dihydropteroate synthase n=2 Tax=Legionella taurinensis TaxID=70611 RepID=A0A3A5M2C8_9GAMM|nr:dihydropteroate synthase [Legionella taurinensis]PUT43432.1 dihydropteroate synthase [Legionella taurinensis]PUT45879.1 dihydropteroate synthase [Legionella taurinensis]PUT47791.1 dihydropteroate synthase [Legionella taurinensis]RJT48808.1 dihydropteroate synthase [Legionella taurinensis]